MIVVLGGTFDPVHLGHISIANQVKDHLGITSLQLMPCAQPVHRAPTQSSASDRLAMLEMAVADHPGLLINRLELERGGQSYTVDSLRLLRQQTDEPLAFVIGADAFNDFANWREPGQILALANLIVCHRPGVSINADLYTEARVHNAEQLINSKQGMIYAVAVEQSHCSSTAIRKAIAEGKPPADCLPPSVLHYITERKLYRSHGA